MGAATAVAPDQICSPDSKNVRALETFSKNMSGYEEAACSAMQCVDAAAGGGLPFVRYGTSTISGFEAMLWLGKGFGFGSAQRPTHEDLALRIDAVDLEDVLRQIEADGANLCHGRLLSMRSTTSSWHSDAVAGAVHPITPSAATERSAAPARP